MNSRTELAIEYHRATEHDRDEMTTRSVPTAIVPRTYKLYRDLPPIPLPSTMPGRQAIMAGSSAEHVNLDLTALSALLHYSAGIVRRTVVRGKTMEFRAASCTGALYHIETYIVAGPIDGLEAGIYHYGINDNALRMLRTGDYRRAVLEATCGNQAIADARALIVHTSTFWRNAWRYEARAYRHTYWDDGTMVANLLAVAAAHGIEASLAMAFIDAQINALLGLPKEKEVAVSLVALGTAGSPLPESPGVTPISLTTVPLSPIEIEYPAIATMHRASSLSDCDEFAPWRMDGLHSRTELFDVDALSPSKPIEDIIERRRSARRLSRRTLTNTKFQTLIASATASINGDFGSPEGSLDEIYFVVNAVEGMEAGLYMQLREDGKLKLLKAGDFRDAAEHAALNQPIAGDAALNLYFVADLDSLLDRFGNRGYRAAQIEAGIRAGRTYLAAYGLGLEATGLTFYDAEVSRLFDTAPSKAVMLSIAIG